MSEIHAILRTLKVVAAGTLALALAMSASAVSAAPLAGVPLYWNGGDVTITVGPSDAGYTSEFRLFFASGDFYVATNRDLGVVVTVPASVIAIDHAIWDELPFGILIQETGDVFLSGDASKNPDGIIHAAIDDLGGGAFRVGFEDRFGGADLDFNDNVVLLEGGVATSIPGPRSFVAIEPNDNGVPEPGSLALLGLGLAGLAASRRRRQ